MLSFFVSIQSGFITLEAGSRQETLLLLEGAMLEGKEQVGQILGC
jgi:hypothetical protein